MFLNNLKMLARNAEQALFIYRFLCMIIGLITLLYRILAYMKKF